jgi:glycosyltransferase involved in cell wall biosynthesis
MLTALYLTQNEEEFLPRSVASVINDVSEVVIIDMQSTDRTVSEAEYFRAAFPGKVRVHTWDTCFDEFCEYRARNVSLEFARGDWLAILDADQVMSDGWAEAVKPHMSNPNCDSIAVKYEHLVASQQYIHTAFYEKQHNNDLHPEVPLHQVSFFRKTERLHAHAAAETCKNFRPQHHSRFDESVPSNKRVVCNGATVFHYGFAKRNMMYMAEYRIRRGDYTQDQAQIQKMVDELHACGNAFRFISQVKHVDYGPESVPTVMRPYWDEYNVVVDKDGQITRTLAQTGEMV